MKQSDGRDLKKLLDLSQLNNLKNQMETKLPITQDTEFQKIIGKTGFQEAIARVKEMQGVIGTAGFQAVITKALET